MPFLNTEIAIFEPDRFAQKILTMPDQALIDMVAGKEPTAPLTQLVDITKHARSTSSETLRRNEALQLHLANNHRLRRSVFDGSREWAMAVCEALPALEDLQAQNRFALAAAQTEARRDVLAAIVVGLAKVLQSSGGGPAPERVSAVVETLADFEDTESIYGSVFRGFSIPTAQVAARRIKETSVFMPTPAEMLRACIDARRFWRDVEFASRRHIALLVEARDELFANPPTPTPEPSDPDWF
ncbi:hypothetical protein [Roseinatronobacter alkalisoli]|uniref:Uncharacterized protein n=1 Tax=Roseinatronobacter alkalisoli TaxID=3028235 RepID=A0ABT5TDK6_9RHOB|nr:hypothetical protein [Roseinatronobacter sp. HJB301]MDD7973199.1 hypothetical protein [Roseinatronobacter sp. HJB301]